MKYKYKAFISYSHHDEKWGRWLHRCIERYQVPKGLVGQDTQYGMVPKRLFPVFRDREELPTAANLSNIIKQALTDSSHLIVICSPNSAKSQWVNEEVKAFKKLGRQNRILCLIVDGEPNTERKPELGFEECFPPAVRFTANEEGDLSTEEAEPIAADVRPGKDGKRNSLLKILSGMIGIGLDELMQRELKRRKIQKTKIYANIILIALLAVCFGYFFMRGQKSEDLLNVKLPEIMQAMEAGNRLKVFKEATELLEVYDDNEILLNYIAKVAMVGNIKTEPMGVQVSYKLVEDSNDRWINLGTTPVTKHQFPPGLVDIRYQLSNGSFVEDRTHPWYLRRVDNLFVLPDHTNYADGFKLYVGGNMNLSFPGIDHLSKKRVEAYAISLKEVTNAEYREFLRAGGYKKPEYWDFPFKMGDKLFKFEQVMSRFTDAFGSPGPVGWTYGQYPSSKDDFPVTGISWFEARAYARFREMQLPDVYQWANAARLSRAANFVPKSNFSKSSLVSTINPESANEGGLENIAGNAREWIRNPLNTDRSKYAILGGSYLDDDYFFNDYYGQDAFNRGPGNGLRLVQNLGSLDVEPGPAEVIGVSVRDFMAETPVSDEVFQIFLGQFDYANDPLKAKVSTKKVGDFTVDRYETPAMYQSEKDEKLVGYVFYDPSLAPPYKPIIFFPGSGAIHQPKTEVMVQSTPKSINYLLKEGYALIHPIYKSTYERGDELKSDYPDESDSYKNHVIMWGRDYRRSIDYIASRDDMDMTNLSYYGISWGGEMANILLAIDDRVQMAVLYVAGLCFQKAKIEVDAINYTPRIKMPTLMLNGRFDQFFPLETSQKPMFQFLGTPDEDKEHYVFQSGHNVPQKELIARHLGWLKRYEK